MVATTKNAALWDVTRVPTFRGIRPLMFGSGIFRNVSAVPDCTMYMSVDRILYKKNGYTFGSLPAVCVLTLFWIFTCSLFRFYFRLLLAITLIL